jgi:hypothetical protein
MLGSEHAVVVASFYVHDDLEVVKCDHRNPLTAFWASITYMWPGYWWLGVPSCGVGHDERHVR